MASFLKDTDVSGSLNVADNITVGGTLLVDGVDIKNEFDKINSVPSPTADDNGKFLRVSNGVVTWQSIPTHSVKIITVTHDDSSTGASGAGSTDYLYIDGYDLSDITIASSKVIGNTNILVQPEICQVRDGVFCIDYQFKTLNGSSVNYPQITFTILCFKGYSSESIYSGGGLACFVSGTKVLTKNGQVNIEDVKIGDTVMSYNTSAEIDEEKEVYDIYSHEVSKIYNITLENDNTISSSWSHEFYVVDKNRVLAKDLQVGDILITQDKEMIAINEINIENRTETVYDLQVSDNHNYYVGEDSVLVYSENI